MTNKTLSLLSLGILALLVLTSFASATITLTPSTTTLAQDNSTSVTFTIFGADTSEVTTLTAVSSSSEITFTPFFTEDTLISDGSSTMTYTVTGDFEFEEEYKVIVTATSDNGSEETNDDYTRTVTLSFEKNTDFCTYKNDFDLIDDDYLKIKKIEITNTKGFGDDDVWYPFDEIEVSVTIKVPASDVDIEDIKLEWGLYDKDSDEWVIDVDDEEEFDLDGGDSKIITFSFNLDDKMDRDLDELKGGKFVLYVRVTGDADADEEDDPDVYEKTLCHSDFIDESEFEIQIESNFVVLDDIIIADEVSCGEEIQITADVWNIGSKKQENVYVVIYNKELGINKKVVIGDIDAFESGKLNTEITIPEEAEEKTYSLTFYVYDEDGDLFETKEDDESTFSSFLKIEGSCSTTPTAAISAKLDSEAKAGQDLIVKATIINTGSETKTFTISLDSYSDWASSAVLDKSSVTLGAGQSEDVLITLKVLSDAEGENGFDIEVLEGTKYMFQPVSVTIEKASFFPSLTGLVSGFGNNAYLYGIGALNLLLIAAIIFVAVKVARRKKQE